MKISLFRIIIFSAFLASILVVCISSYSVKKNVAQIDIQQEMFNAVQSEDIDKLKTLLDSGVSTELKNRYGWTLLMIASDEGKAKSAITLLSYGANPNPHVPDVFPLLLAAQHGYLVIVKELLIRGAKVDQQTELGETALIRAAGNGHKEVVEFLFMQGANINLATRNGCTALMLAYDKLGEIEMLNTLIRLGASIEAKDSKGWTPLFYATRARRYAAVQFLLGMGANVNVEAAHGDTVLALAERLQDEELVKLFTPLVKVKPKKLNQ